MPINKQCLVWYPDGRVDSLDHKPSLIEAQKIVGGWIEIVHPRGRYDGQLVQMLVNEEGHIHHMPLNDAATALYRGIDLDRNLHATHDQIAITDHWIAGPAIILVGWRFS